MWASQQLLQSYAVFHSRIENGPVQQQPLQYAYTLEQAQLSPSIAYYHHSFLLLQPDRKQADRALRAESDAEISHWAPDMPDKELQAVAPRYCRRPPNAQEEAAMQRWIRDEMNTRCHPTRLAVRCERTRGYDSFVPCPQELMNHLAEGIHICIYAHKHIYLYMHTYIYPIGPPLIKVYIYIHTLSLHIYIDTLIHIHIYSNIHTHIHMHTYIHKYLHTNINIHTYIKFT